jgi:hypothetical protein
MRTRPKQVEVKIILIGIIAVALYLVSFGVFIFGSVSYCTGNMEAETSLLLLCVIKFAILPINNKMFDYYLDDKHRLIEIPDYPY